MKRIFFDTNMLMLPTQFGLDIFEEIENILNEKVEFYVFDRTIEELEEISKGKGKNATAARVALSLIRKKGVKIITTKKPVDDALLSLEDVIIATNDKTLRKRLKAKGIKTIYLRSKKYLEMG
jgi:hypothetical protein